MSRFQKFRNTIYFDKYKIMILDNGRFDITDINFNIIDDLNGQGYKTRRRASNSIKYTHVDKKFKPMNEFQENKEKVRVLVDKIITEQDNQKKSFEELRKEPDFQKKYELGLKRMALVSCAIAVLLAIPLFFLIDTLVDSSLTIRMLSVYFYMILVIVGVWLSPKISEKIWK